MNTTSVVAFLVVHLYDIFPEELFKFFKDKTHQTVTRRYIARTVEQPGSIYMPDNAFEFSIVGDEIAKVTFTIGEVNKGPTSKIIRTFYFVHADIMLFRQDQTDVTDKEYFRRQVFAILVRENKSSEVFVQEMIRKHEERELGMKFTTVQICTPVE